MEINDFLKSPFIKFEKISPNKTPEGDYEKKGMIMDNAYLKYLLSKVGVPANSTGNSFDNRILIRNLNTMPQNDFQNRQFVHCNTENGHSNPKLKFQKYEQEISVLYLEFIELQNKFINELGSLKRENAELRARLNLLKFQPFSAEIKPNNSTKEAALHSQIQECEIKVENLMQELNELRYDNLEKENLIIALKEELLSFQKAQEEIFNTKVEISLAATQYESEIMHLREELLLKENELEAQRELIHDLKGKLNEKDLIENSNIVYPLIKGNLSVELEDFWAWACFFELFLLLPFFFDEDFCLASFFPFFLFLLFRSGYPVFPFESSPISWEFRDDRDFKNS